MEAQEAEEREAGEKGAAEGAAAAGGDGDGSAHFSPGADGTDPAALPDGGGGAAGPARSTTSPPLQRPSVQHPNHHNRHNHHLPLGAASWHGLAVRLGWVAPRALNTTSKRAAPSFSRDPSKGGGVPAQAQAASSAHGKATSTHGRNGGGPDVAGGGAAKAAGSALDARRCPQLSGSAGPASSAPTLELQRKEAGSGPAAGDAAAAAAEADASLRRRGRTGAPPSSTTAGPVPAAGVQGAAGPGAGGVTAHVEGPDPAAHSQSGGSLDLSHRLYAALRASSVQVSASSGRHLGLGRNSCLLSTDANAPGAPGQ